MMMNVCRSKFMSLIVNTETRTRTVFLFFLCLQPSVHSAAQNLRFYELKGRQQGSEKANAFRHNLMPQFLFHADSLEILRGGLVSATNHGLNGDLNKKIEVLKGLAPVALRLKFKDEYRACVKELSTTVLYAGNFEEALKYNFELLEMHYELGDNVDETTLVLESIGIVYYNLKNYQKAISYYNEALEIFESGGKSKNLVSRLQLRLSLCYLSINNFDIADSYFQKAVGTCDSACLEANKVDFDFIRGMILLRTDRIDSSIAHFRKSLTLAKTRRELLMQLKNIIFLSEAMEILGDYDLALQTLQDPVFSSMAFKYYVPERLRVYEDLTKLLVRKKNFRMAADYQKKCIELKDSVYSLIFTSKMMDVESGYRARQNQKKIEAGRELILLKENTTQLQYIVNLIFGSLILISVCFAIALQKIKKTITRINNDLREKVNEGTKDLEKLHFRLSQSESHRQGMLVKAFQKIDSSFVSMEAICDLAIKGSAREEINLLKSIKIAGNSIRVSWQGLVRKASRGHS